MATALWYGAKWLFDGGVWVAVAVLIWACIGRGVRGLSHLREHPEDVLITPLMVAVVALVAVPIKTWALVTMNRQGWLTRTAQGRVLGQRELVAAERPMQLLPAPAEVGHDAH